MIEVMVEVVSVVEVVCVVEIQVVGIVVNGLKDEVVVEVFSGDSSGVLVMRSQVSWAHEAIIVVQNSLNSL